MLTKKQFIKKKLLLQFGCAEVNGLSCLCLDFCVTMCCSSFCTKGFKIRLVHTVFVKHNFINNSPVEQRQSGERFQRQFPVLQLLQA